MSSEPLSLDDIDKMSTAHLRAELRKRHVDCTDSSRKTLVRRLREAMDSNYAMKCYSGTKCETGCLFWDIEWNAIECISAIGPGHAIKSTNIKVGDYDWYAELFPKGELAKNDINDIPSNTLNNTANSITTTTNTSTLNHLNVQMAPALFLSICKTAKPVQMRFTVQLYDPRSNRWSDPVISSLRVFLRNNHGWGWKEWMDYNDLKRDYECSRKLKLKISIDVYGPVNTHIVNDKISFNIQSDLSNKMNELFKCGTHSDVILMISGYTIYPNKCKTLKQANTESLDDDDENEEEVNTNQRKRKLNDDDDDDQKNNPNVSYKRRRLSSNGNHSAVYDCIDIEENVNNVASTSPFMRNKEIEKLSVLGIDEESKDKNGRTFVTLEIRAHRCILASFSPYFESMFAHKFKENMDGKIYIGNKVENDDNMDNVEKNDMNDVIDNVDPYVMKVLVEYIYTEQIETCIDRYLLLLLADRYQIDRLVMLCLQDLTNEMNINNVTTILSIASKFNEKYSCANKVKLICLDFICKNISFVMETSSYKNCIKNDKNITQEILTAFANKHKKSRNNTMNIPQKRRFPM